MRPRLLAVALVLVITGAPVVTAVCEAVCAARADEAATTGEHHSCHERTSPANAPAVSSVPHLCGHADDSPRAIAQSLWLLMAPAVVVAAFASVPPAVEVVPAAAASAHAPPRIARRSTLLRI